jgi:hypothetical protein
MRHIGTLIAALVIAPLAWILTAYGQDRSAQTFANAGSGGAVNTGDVTRALLFLAAAGVLLGLIATLRFSPLGAAVSGAAYIAIYAMLLIAPHGLLNLFNHTVSVAGQRADLSTPIRTGTTLVLGAAMLVAVASVGRWRRWPRPEAVNQGAYEADDPLGPDGLLSPTTRGAEPDPVLHSTAGSGDGLGGSSSPSWAFSLRSGQ